MIQRTLIGFAGITAAVLIVLWLATGGARDVAATARGIGNPFSNIFSGEMSAFRLPWQPEQMTIGTMPDIADENAGKAGLGLEEELYDTQKEYEDIERQMREAQTFGYPSPHRGSIALSQGAASESGAQNEYVELTAAAGNTAPVKISGWSLQSALTGVRAYIPRGAHPFILGTVNAQNDIYLNQGESAIVSTGASPVGTSFKENMCTGYLGTLQRFTPPLESSCPAPADELPLTPENIRSYGEACFNLAQTLPSCVFPADVPASVSPSCRIFLMNNLSYNGCVQNHRHESGFARGTWRIYLNSVGELWRNSHDIIRLLDSEGRTVDVISY